MTVPTTTLSGTQSIRLVQHAGNTGGNNGGLLDTLDDRLYSAMIRNGRLWTAQLHRRNDRVASTAAASVNNAVRWYEFQNLTTTPTVAQSGTVFDNAATRAAARQYWIPSVTTTGQGHSVVGFSMAGTRWRDPAYLREPLVERYTLGNMTGPPTTTAQARLAYYGELQPAADRWQPGRRWGDTRSDR